MHVRLEQTGLVRTLAGLAAAGLLALMAAPDSAHAAAADMKTFDGAKFHYSVSLPVGCRHVRGPGTLDAVCADGFDPDKSAIINSTIALVLEISAEAVPADAGKSVEALAQAYGEAQFTQELPEAVCGEQDKARVKITNVKSTPEPDRVVYSADVECPAVKFLALDKRRAVARTVITPGVRYRVMARAQEDDFEKNKATIDAFLDSLQLKPTPASATAATEAPPAPVSGDTPPVEKPQ
jgi:hypothetical protein